MLDKFINIDELLVSLINEAKKDNLSREELCAILLKLKQEFNDLEEEESNTKFKEKFYDFLNS